MNGQTKSSWRPRPPKTPPQCEPTITCEGYTFQIRKAPKTTSNSDPGTMINCIAACLKSLAELQKTLNGLSNPNQPLNMVDAATLSTSNAIKEDLRELLEQHGIHNCALYQKILQPLSQFVPPVGIPIPTVQQYFSSLFEETLQECICSALLPPCPGPVDENCVPIATVTVNCQNGCRIVRVCNWENRRIILTFPSLEYWFESFLRQAGVPQFIVNSCCVSPQAGLNAGFGNLLDNLLKGNNDFQSIFKQLGSIWKGFLSKLTGNQ
jgi:hypothetical protein